MHMKFIHILLTPRKTKLSSFLEKHNGILYGTSFLEHVDPMNIMTYMSKIAAEALFYTSFLVHIVYYSLT